MYPAENRSLKLVIIAIVVVIGLAGLFIFLATHHGNNKAATPKPATSETSHYDANSGATVSTIPGEHNTYGIPANSPVFLGTAVFLGRGFTTDQISNMQTAFYQYSQINNLNITQVSITANSLTTGRPDETTGISQATFGVVFNSKTTVKATMQYSGLSSIELFLYDTNGAQLYDSGVIDTSS